ncbi:MAG: UvrD-helicase domain-containing protein, partial [Paludibacter sp.]|nr:UvrD-helicase domain-containing protein [Paludibacter sp.]
MNRTAPQLLNIYRASAGSGKTYRLTGDYISLLFAANDCFAYQHILSVTFTNKATEEMKARIVAELFNLSQANKSPYINDLMQNFGLTADEVKQKAHKLLVNILHDYSAFQVSTIDSFFQQVIRAFARELGLSGDYALELDTDTVLHLAVDTLFDSLAKSQNHKLLEWMTDYVEQRIENGEKWNTKADIEALGREIFKENYQYKATEIYDKMHNREFLKNYQAQLYAVKNAFDNNIENEARNALKIIENNGLTVEDFKGGSRSAMKTLQKLLTNNYDVSATFLALSDEVTNCYTKTTSASVILHITNAYENGLQQHLSQIKKLLQGDDYLVYNTAKLTLKHLSIFGIMTDLANEIKTLTSEQNTMVISDTNLLLNKIIDDSDTPFIYEKTGSFLQHFLIDEFQDTSHLQWNNFSPLVRNSMDSGNANLLVGDVKQSIYRWRNSNWKLLDNQIISQMGEANVNLENLDTNWRSNRLVVEFNNKFFRTAVQNLQDNFDLQSNTSAGNITHAYEALEQNVKPNADDGYVNFEFLNADEENDANWKEVALLRLPLLLEDLQERGYAPSDIAILVRTNSQTSKIVRFLMQYKLSDKAKDGYSYDIMGNEGILLSSAHSVNFIIALLRLLINPADKLAQTTAGYEYLYAKQGNQSNALAACFDNIGTQEQISAVFTSSENQRLLDARNSSLFILISEIINIFNLHEWTNETLFIQGFQDLVFKYISGKTSDIRNFLDWWDTGGNNKSVTAPENKNTFRIMTIHKSKGLDFQVVILPFCDWKMEETSSGRKQNILWCATDKQPFCQLPLLPLDYSKELKKSIFRNEYFDELLQQYIDNLNVAYVAFTRAKEEMYAFAPMQKTIAETSKKEEKTLSLASLLFDYFNANAVDLTILDNENSCYSYGEKTQKHKESAFLQAEKMNLGKSYSTTDRLSIRRQTLDFQLKKRPLAENRRNYGIVMHDILRAMRVRSDQPNAIAKMLRQGRINNNEIANVEQELAQFWTLPKVDEWFAENVRIINECDILTPDYRSYRPDRIIFDNKKVVVIDYKFGDTQEVKYNHQVSLYMTL